MVRSPAMASHDAVFVGAGINSLAGAALLARAGWNVCVLEREEVAGGCIRTVEGLTAPGFTHELMASWHPLFSGSAAYAELRDELGRRGLEYLNTDLPTGSAFPDGSASFVWGSLEQNVAELERHTTGDGAAWESMFNGFMANADLSFGLLSTELWSTAGLGLGRRAYRRLGRRGVLAFSGTMLASCRDWLSATFASEAAHGLLAPWVLHTGLGPDQATSGFMTQVIACALQLGGMPVPRGGGVKLAEALAAIVTDAGGTVRRAPRWWGDDPVFPGGCGERDADGAVRASARRVGRTGGRRRCSGSVPLRARRDADPHGARRAPSLEGAARRRAGADADRPRHPRSGRGLARCQRGRARPAPGGGDDRLRPALRARPVSRTRRQVGHLDPTAGAPRRPRQGRRGRRARRRRRLLERDAA